MKISHTSPQSSNIRGVRLGYLNATLIEIIVALVSLSWLILIEPVWLALAAANVTAPGAGLAELSIVQPLAGRLF